MCFHHLSCLNRNRSALVSELLNNNSLFVGQLYEDKSLVLRACELIFLQLTTKQELLLNNLLLELIYFLILTWNPSTFFMDHPN